MYLLLLLTGFVLLHQGSTLVCNNCKTREDTCDSDQIQCPAKSTHCGTYEVKADSETFSTYAFMIGGCFKAEDCQTVMFDFDFGQITYIISCCNTDKCNTGLPTLPHHRQNPNGKKCYSCGETCEESLDCYGEQTYCATMTDNGKMRKGCATKSICKNPPLFIQENIKNITCCDTDFCNSSDGIRTSLLLVTAMSTLLFYFT
ncbi:unnamed protein product [Knipowitschia caucasica]